jgi:ABC-type sugar transport system ATPase subunit
LTRSPGASKLRRAPSITITFGSDELSYCDRVYVFRNGVIAADLMRSEVSEDSVIGASFAEVV